MEHVLVVPTKTFQEIGHFQGFITDTGKYLDELLKPENMSYRPRPEMEQDPSFKQLIPYVIFRYTTDSGQVLLFQYTRGSGQGEQRLHAKRSIGVGGHICSDDAAAESVYDEGMRRELEEEVRIDTPYRAHLAGLLNDDLTDVGKVHLGVVHLFDVEHLDVYPSEAEMMDAGFRPVDELLRDREQFETWSQICLKALFEPSV